MPSGWVVMHCAALPRCSSCHDIREGRVPVGVVGLDAIRTQRVARQAAVGVERHAVFVFRMAEMDGA